MTTAGAVLFARYAHAPNQLGYCGPAEAASLVELAATGHTDADVTGIARRFSGAWPYAELLAELAGIDDPLDERVMRAYWTGGPLLDTVDCLAFGHKLIELFQSRAGHYWSHLTPDLLPEAAPTHGFHVFGIYPWTRLLSGGNAAQPLHVLDNCRIRDGRVVRVDGDHLVVRSRRLTWDGRRLGLAGAGEERVRFRTDGRSFVGRPGPGDRVALHWDSACDRLDEVDVGYLRRWTGRQLRLTNARLARTEEDVA
jgi:Family of unknown function (DUF6390)